MEEKADYGLYEEIGRAICRVRKRKMSQQALASAIGLSRASVVNLEKGRHRIQIHVLYEIGVALDIDPRDLLPPINRRNAAHALPEDMSEKLNPREQLAVGRLFKQKKET